MKETTKKGEVIFASPDLQVLLNKFNSSSIVSGSINANQIQKIIDEMGLQWKKGILEKNLINQQNISFYEFLVVLEQLQGSVRGNRIIQFMKLLGDYKIQCENKQNYDQAEKIFYKLEQIKQKQIQRVERQLNQQLQMRATLINTMQKDRTKQFQTAWKQYKNEFQQKANRTINNIKQKHKTQLQNQQNKIRKQFALKPRMSHKFRQLKQQQKLLVQNNNYSKAKQINKLYQKLQKQSQKQFQNFMNKTIQLKTQKIKKRQEIIMFSQLNKIQTMRDLSISKQKRDAEKLVLNMKKLKQDINHRDVVQNRQKVNKLRHTITSLGYYNSNRSRCEEQRKRVKTKVQDIVYEKQEVAPKKKKQKDSIRIKCFSLPRSRNSSFLQNKS